MSEWRSFGKLLEGGGITPPSSPDPPLLNSDFVLPQFDGNATISSDYSEIFDPDHTKISTQIGFRPHGIVHARSVATSSDYRYFVPISVLL